MNLNVEWAGDLPPPLQSVVTWGMQTLCYAMSKRAALDGRELAPEELEETMGGEAIGVLTEMWERALEEAEAKEPYHAEELMKGLARQVIDWSVEHARG